MSENSSCDPGVNGTSTCDNSVTLNPATGEARTSATVQTGNGGTALDTGEADAAGYATVDLYLQHAAASATATLVYEVVTTPLIGGTPDNRARNTITLSAGAGCNGCAASNTLELESANPTIGTPGEAPNSRGSIQVTITNPTGALLPKGIVHVSLASQSAAYIGTGVGTGAGSAFAKSDNAFLNVSLSSN